MVCKVCNTRIAMGRNTCPNCGSNSILESPKPKSRRSAALPQIDYSAASESEATELDDAVELDMPVVGWGDDLWWTGLGWESKPSRTKAPIKDPHQIRVNAYRVLLTRGRDGVVVFVPKEPKLDLTHEALVAAGMDHLELVDL